MGIRFSSFLLLLLGLCSSDSALASGQRVSFKTEDGWTIHATLTLPDNRTHKPPVVILLPSEAHDRAAFGVYRDPGPGRLQYPGLGPVLNSRGLATLSLDLRGRGLSLRDKPLTAFTPEEMANVPLDVRAAIDFLSSNQTVDSSRLALVGVTASADPAILGWDGDHRVRAIALISGRLTDRARQTISRNPNIPLLLLVSGEDRRGFADMTDAYFSSTSKWTDIQIHNGMGIGTMMFSVYRYRFPEEQPLHEKTGDWLANQLLMTGRMEEVSYQTEDGWTIHGNLRIPETGSSKVPAVILMHSGLSDRNAYAELEIDLSRAGLAVLNIDWRGKGKSTGKGKYFEVTRAERDRGHLDVKAGVEFLNSVAGIDGERIGVLGTVIGARYAMAALAEDPRIRTGVVLTGYIPTEAEKQYLRKGTVPVLYVTSRGHGPVTRALREIHGETKGGGSELIEYGGGAIGYQLFKLDRQLMPRVVRWLQEKLGADG